MKIFLQYAWVGVAGFLGAIARLAVVRLFGRWAPSPFPYGTLFINIGGSLFLGWFMTFCSGHEISDTAKLAIATGFVGAYTTFSTFMYESSALAEGGAEIAAFMNLLGSLVLGLIAVRLGIALGHRWP